jgi:hypothetical protein
MTPAVRRAMDEDESEGERPATVDRPQMEHQELGYRRRFGEYNVNKAFECVAEGAGNRFVGNFSTGARVVFSDGVNRVTYGRNHLSQTGGLDGRIAP